MQWKFEITQVDGYAELFRLRVTYHYQDGDEWHNTSWSPKLVIRGLDQVLAIQRELMGVTPEWGNMSEVMHEAWHRVYVPVP